MAIMSTTTKLLRLVTNRTTRTPILRYGSYGPLGSMMPYSSSAAQKEGADVIGSRHIDGVKDYEDYRRSRYGEITHKALLVDAVGTLVVPSQPMAQVLPPLSFCTKPSHPHIHFFFLCLVNYRSTISPLSVRFLLGIDMHLGIEYLGSAVLLHCLIVL